MERLRRLSIKNNQQNHNNQSPHRKQTRAVRCIKLLQKAQPELKCVVPLMKYCHPTTVFLCSHLLNWWYFILKVTVWTHEKQTYGILQELLSNSQLLCWGEKWVYFYYVCKPSEQKWPVFCVKIYKSRVVLFCSNLKLYTRQLHVTAGKNNNELFLLHITS